MRKTIKPIVGRYYIYIYICEDIIYIYMKILYIYIYMRKGCYLGIQKFS